MGVRSNSIAPGINSLRKITAKVAPSGRVYDGAQRAGHP